MRFRDNPWRVFFATFCAIAAITITIGLILIHTGVWR